MAHRDEMTIRIADVLMQVRRCSALPVPSEITVVIPHAEIRRWFYENGQLAEEELILDSLTIVDSPRHEPAAGRSQLPPPPRATWRYFPGSKSDR
ncbi:MAG: hypothetical protein ABSC17_01365 [Thermacetogeniaceae bacterium]